MHRGQKEKQNVAVHEVPGKTWQTLSDKIDVDAILSIATAYSKKPEPNWAPANQLFCRIDQLSSRTADYKPTASRTFEVSDLFAGLFAVLCRFAVGLLRPQR